MNVPNGSAFPFDLAERIARGYDTLAGLLDAQADHTVRVFADPDDDFTGAHAEDIRRRVAELAETEYTLADEARQSAGAVRDLIAEALLAAQREETAGEAPPAPLHRPSSGSRWAI